MGVGVGTREKEEAGDGAKNLEGDRGKSNEHNHMQKSGKIIRRWLWLMLNWMAVFLMAMSEVVVISSGMLNKMSAMVSEAERKCSVAAPYSGESESRLEGEAWHGRTTVVLARAKENRRERPCN